MKLNVAPTGHHPVIHEIAVIQDTILDYLPVDDDNYYTFQQFASNKYFNTRLNISKDDAAILFQKHHESKPTKGQGFEYMLLIFGGIKSLLGAAFYQVLLSLPWFSATERKIVCKTPFGPLQMMYLNIFSLHFSQPVSILGVFHSKTKSFICANETLRDKIEKVNEICLWKNGLWEIGSRDLCIRLNKKWKVFLHSITLQIPNCAEFRTATLPYEVHECRCECNSQCNLILDHKSSSELNSLRLEKVAPDISLCNMSISIPLFQLRSMNIENQEVIVKIDVLKQFPPRFREEEMNFIRYCKTCPDIQFDKAKEQNTFEHFRIMRGNVEVSFEQDHYMFALDEQHNCSHLQEFGLLQGNETELPVEIRTSEIPSTWKAFSIHPTASVSIRMDYFQVGLCKFQVKNARETSISSSLTWQGIPTSLRQINICKAGEWEEVSQYFPFLFDIGNSEKLQYKQVEFQIDTLNRVIRSSHMAGAAKMNPRFFWNSDLLPIFLWKCVE